MARIEISTVMDAIATAITEAELAPRAYGWPVESASVPCAVVGYPTDLDFDMTFQDGSDRAVFPIYFLVGKGTDASARDALSAVIAGATNIKNTLDGDVGGTVQTARVTDCRVEEVSVASVPYLSATFMIEVYS